MAPSFVAPFQLRPMASAGKMAAANVAQPIAPSSATSVSLTRAMPAAVIASHHSREK